MGSQGKKIPVQQQPAPLPPLIATYSWTERAVAVWGVCFVANFIVYSVMYGAVGLWCGGVDETTYCGIPYADEIVAWSRFFTNWHGWFCVAVIGIAQLYKAWHGGRRAPAYFAIGFLVTIALPFGMIKYAVSAAESPAEWPPALKTCAVVLVDWSFVFFLAWFIYALVTQARKRDTHLVRTTVTVCLGFGTALFGSVVADTLRPWL